MGNPTESRTSIFDPDNKYMGATYQTGQFITDWERTQTDRELSYFIHMATTGKMAGNLLQRSGSGTRTLAADGSGSLTKNLTFAGGISYHLGRFLFINTSAFLYDESGEVTCATPENYVVKGTVTANTAVTPSVQYYIEDTERNLSTTLFSVSGFRILFTSGVESGNIFDMSRHSATEYKVDGDLSAVIVGDTYVAYTPELLNTTPEELYLVTWFEDRSKTDNTDLEDPVYGTQKTPQRKQLRWAIIPEWNGATSVDPTSGFTRVKLCTINPSGTTIAQTDITENINKYDQGSTHFYTHDVLNTIVRNLENVNDISFASGYGPLISTKQDGSISNVNVLANNIQSGRWPDLDIPFSAEVAASNIDATAAAAITYGTMVVSVEDITGTPTVVRSTGSSVNEASDSLVISVSGHDASSKTVNAFSMGEIPVKQGFDYVVAVASIVVTPGQLFWNGKLYQFPRTKTIAATIASNWVSGSVPSADSWFYLYVEADPSSATPNKLTIKLDVVRPKWDGSHEVQTTSSQKFCIGIGRYSASAGTCYAATCRNNKVDFYNKMLALIVSTDTTTVFTTQPPLGISDMCLWIKGTSLSGDGTGTITAYDSTPAVTLTLLEHEIRFESSTLSETFIDMAGSITNYQFTSSALMSSSGTVKIYYKSFTFNPVHWPSSWNFLA